MTMHLAHPAITTTGKRKGKFKWASAEQKRQHQELEQQWQNLKNNFDRMSQPAKKKFKPKEAQGPSIPAGRSTTKHIPSVDTGQRGAVSSKAPQMYTGNNVLGITIVHKSCLQPIFSKQEAEDAAKMRR